MKKVGILESEDFSSVAINILKEKFIVECYNGDGLEHFLRDKYALFVRLKYKIDDTFVENAPRLEVICSPTTGLNHINVKKNIKVISLKGEQDFLATIRATPEHSFGLAIALLRKYKEAFLRESNREWNRDKYKGEELYNNQIGIIGYGRVGKQLAKYFNAFDAKIYYYDIMVIENDEMAIRVESIEELCEKSKIIFLCASYSPNLNKKLGDDFFELLKDKYFINTSRGELIDEISFLKFIKSGQYKGIALDVLSDETGKNNLEMFLRLAEGKNVIITPHIAGATFDSMHKTEIYIASKLCTLNLK